MGRGASSEGPTERPQTHDIAAGPTPSLRRCALPATGTDTDSGRGLWEKLLCTE